MKGSTPRSRRVQELVVRLALLVASLALAFEALSCVLVPLAPRWLGEKIRRTPEIFEAQSESLERMFHPRPEALGTFDADLGWRPKPGTWTEVDRINAQGLRSEREYVPAPSGGRRLAVFGDSFVYGSDVTGEEAWPRVLERGDPALEVMNYGVPGYGPDQAYLRFLAEGAALSPQIVALAVTTPSLERLLTVVGSFRARSIATKPRFVLDDGGELVLVPNPIRDADDAARIVAHPREILGFAALDYWYDPLVFQNPLYDRSSAMRLLVTLWSRLKRRYLDPDRPLVGPPGGGVFNERSTAFRILAQILEAFVGRASAGGAEPLVLILPDGQAVARSLAGRPGPCDPVRDHCARRGLPCLDASDAFRAAADGVFRPNWFVGEFHYSASGNRVVAEWLRERLRRRGPTDARPALRERRRAPGTNLGARREPTAATSRSRARRRGRRAKALLRPRA